MVVPKGIESLVTGIGPVIVGGVSTGMAALGGVAASASAGVRPRSTSEMDA